jgi:hypothetical protein
MALEEDFSVRMQADATLMAILTGGVYTVGTVGDDGIGRDNTPDAFDSFGYLKPTCLIRQRETVPTFFVSDEIALLDSASQLVELYFYQDRGYISIDSALARSYALFKGHIFTSSFAAAWSGTLERLKDNGPLNNASVARQSWTVHKIIGG